MADQITVNSFDHLVLTVADITATLAFYCNGLGMRHEVFHPSDGSSRHALKFGAQKINLHEAATPFEPCAARPTPGSADLCLLSDALLDDWQAHFETMNIPVELGSVSRTGATGPILSLYVRDPDGNLIEISNTLS